MWPVALTVSMYLAPLRTGTVPCPGHGREAHGFACICHSLSQCSQLSGGEELVWEQRQLSREPGSCQELRPGPWWWRGEDWDKERDGERGHGSEGRVGTGGCLPHTSPSLGLTEPISVQGRHFAGSYVLSKEYEQTLVTSLPSGSYDEHRSCRSVSFSVSWFLL